MTRSFGNTVGDSLSLSLGYAERLLKDVTADKFGRFATADGRPVESNHGAFIYGHLALYAPRILKDLGREAPAIPDGCEANFSKDAKCVDDADGSLFPPMDEITSFFFEGYRAALDAIKATDDATFQQPNPLGGGMAQKFPTLGSMHNFYVGGHIMIHMGQMSAWRRMLGLGAA